MESCLYAHAEENRSSDCRRPEIRSKDSKQYICRKEVLKAVTRGGQGNKSVLNIVTGRIQEEERNRRRKAPTATYKLLSIRNFQG